jgi:uncharacterized protein YdhG (YjbR/CyaY superfamily)
MQSKAATVDRYFAELPEERRVALSTLRKLIKEIAPRAVESMMYGMAGYTLDGPFCALAAQKHYMALYCCDELVEKFRPQLGRLDCGKGCIRFRRIEALPLDVIAELLRAVAERRTAGHR